MRLEFTSDPLAIPPLAELRYVLLGLVSWLDVDATGVDCCCCFLNELLLEAWLVANWGLGDGCWGGDLVVDSDLSDATLNACVEGEAVGVGADRFLLFLVFGRFSVPTWDLIADCVIL